MLLDAEGRPIQANGRELEVASKVIIDRFQGPELDPVWHDRSTDPSPFPGKTIYDPAGIENGALTAAGTEHVTPWSPPNPWFEHLRSKRTIIERSLGSDGMGPFGFEVYTDITWRPVERYFHQVGPFYGSGNSWNQPSIAHWHDYSIGALVFHGGWNTAPPLEDAFEPHPWIDGYNQYHQIILDFSFNPFPEPPGPLPPPAFWEKYTGSALAGRQRFAIRAVGGQIEGTYNGQRVWGPVPIPPDMVSDTWGVDMLHLRVEPITNPEPPPDRELYQGVRITQWGARPIFGSLGAYPMSRVVGATMASSAGTSVSPAWPTGTTAGHRGLLWVATTGTLPTISGWSRTAQTISGLRLGSYHRMLEEGDTAPTITVGGGGTVSAVLITEDTPHPRWNEVPFMNSSSTPSVVVDVPNATTWGGPKSRCWAATVSGEWTEITPPVQTTVLAHTPNTGGPPLCVATGIVPGVIYTSQEPRPSLPSQGSVATARPYIAGNTIRWADPRYPL